MKSVIITRTISAPLELVFNTVADVRNFRQAIQHITNIEFLSKQQHGVGTRFRETRLMNGREATVDLEVAEFVVNERVRMLSDAGGTEWDSMFTVEKAGGVTILNLQMDVRPHKFLAKLIMPLFMGKVTGAIESDMNAVKAYCETVAEQA